MQTGDQVKILSGEGRGKVVRIAYVFDENWVAIRMPGGKIVQRSKRGLEPCTPDEPLGNYWDLNRRR